jgi:hypothetical protein
MFKGSPRALFWLFWLALIIPITLQSPAWAGRSSTNSEVRCSTAVVVYSITDGHQARMEISEAAPPCSSSAAVRPRAKGFLTLAKAVWKAAHAGLMALLSWAVRLMVGVVVGVLHWILISAGTA